MQQIKHANDLLAKYKIEHILQALDHPDCRQIYSLGLKSRILPLIDQYIKQEQRQIKIQKEIKKVHQETIDVTQSPRKPYSARNNVLSKLRELDDG